MQKIYLDNFILEEFNFDFEEHRKIIEDFDSDKEIRKYIISPSDSFSDVVEYNSVDNDTIYNKVYLVKNSNNDIIGEIELDGKKENLYLNYAILEKYRKKGYCKKLLREITIYLLKELKTISLAIKRENIKSRKLANRVGYKRVLKDSFGLVKYQITS